jgi:hypothetical protein
VAAALLALPLQALNLPPELASASISLADFMAFSHLRRHHHKLAVALEFCESISRRLDEKVGCRSVVG